MSKTQLPVDLNDLVQAMTWHDDMIETYRYLDRETGQVITIHAEDLPEDDLDGETDGELDDADDEFRKQAKLMEEHPERFIEIEPIESYESFRIMEDFLGEVKHEVVQRRLRRALVERKPFRAFKFVLEEYPELRQRWFDFEEEREMAAAREWLASHDIETTWQRPKRVTAAGKPPASKPKKKK